MKIFKALFLLLGVSIPLCGSHQCSRECGNGDCDPDCSSVDAPNCLIPQADGSFRETEMPQPNRHSCYRTCITPGFFQSQSCEIDLTAPHFENEQLLPQHGPGDKNAYSHFRIFSPGFTSNARRYWDSAFCRVNIECNTASHKDAILSISFQTHELEPPAPSCGSNELQCIDSVQMDLHGLRCTTCGGKPLLCRESLNANELSDLTLQSDGNLTLEFRSNRLGTFRGFQFLTQCVEKDYYDADGCSTPSNRRRRQWPSSALRRGTTAPPQRQDPPPRKGATAPPQRQDPPPRKGTTAPPHSQDSGPRKEAAVPPRKGDDHPHTDYGPGHERCAYLSVPVDAVVVYRRSTVTVVQGKRILYKATNIRFFLLRSPVEGNEIFSVNAPEGKKYPGYGKLSVCWGIADYRQIGVEPQFKPTPAETAIILNLQRRIVNAINQPDIDISDKFDRRKSPHMHSYGPKKPRALPFYPERLTPEEIDEMNEDALAFGDACNGILRATACAYQDQFLGGARRECDP